MTGSVRPGRKPGTWELRVYAGRDPVTGTPRQKSKTVTCGKREAGKALNFFAAEVANNRPSTAVTLNSLMGRHIEGLVTKGRAPDTIRNYRRTAAKIKDGLGKTELRKLTARDLEEFYSASVKKWASSSVALDHRHLSAALQQAVRWEWLDRNVASLAQPPSSKSRPMEPPTLDEVKTLLLEAAKRDVDRAMLVFVAIMTGSRRGELCRLQWCDIGWTDRSMLLRKSKGDGKPHRISLDPATVQALTLYQAKVAERLNHEPEPTRYVFSPDLGLTPWNPKTVTTWWIWLRNKAGVGPVRFHDLRHFSVSHLLDAGVPPKTVADRHGHARTSMTLDVYGHALQARDQEAADVMGRLGIEAPGS